MSKENSLFKEATIKKLVSNVNLTTKHKKAVNKWLDYFNTGKLENEKQAYIEFANIILRDLLDYDISLEGLRHEEENIEFLFKKDGNNLICFEVKGTKTKDLWAYQGRDKKSRETPVNQINSYMYGKKIPYGILTNYRFFVLFDRNEGDKKYHLIDFTDLNKEEKLKEFIAFFSRKQVERGFIAEAIQQSIIEEREFTKEFYKLYHETRLMLIKEFEENSKISREASVHFAQLFLNRLMFVFFAEDTGKIDKRIVEDRVINILDNIHLFSSNSSNISNVLVGLFNDLDKGSDFPIKLFGFNGGLFKHPIPPKIFFKDFRDDNYFKDVNQYSKLKKKELELNENEKIIFNKYMNKLSPIIKNVLLMASFDFNSEVNVNILGHIFEQSISDIEDLKIDSSSRRKKDGIFYTPEYITDYICRNTIITYLSKKGANSVSELIKEYAEDIGTLENKFKSIKILDPACGSGAFLIKATDIMLEIFKEIQEFKQSEGEYDAKKGLKKKSNTTGQIVLAKWNEEEEAREIIENSIYGVDINDESVEITKLSLFLKMARKNRKLTDLSNNIKRGNSLISDPEVAGDLAFDWDKEFKEIMNKGGFDVLIGNPPYVFTRGNSFLDNIKTYIWQNYPHNKGKINLYSVFLELSVAKLLKINGNLGFITPETFIRTSTYSNIRRFIGNNFNIQKINIYGIGVFDNVTAETLILIINNNYSKYNEVLFSKIKEKSIETFKVKQVEFKQMPENRYIYENTAKDKGIFNIINKNCVELGKLVDVRNGIATKAGKKEFISQNKKDDKYKKLLEAPDINRYGFEWSGNYINYDKKLLHRPRKEETFLFKKIMIQRVSSRLICAYDENKFYTFNSINNLVLKNKEFSLKYILSILNSKLIDYYYRKNFSLDASYTITVTKQNLDMLPIPNISLSDQKLFIEKADLMLNLNKEFYDKKNKFFNRIKKSFDLEKINKKIDSFYELEFNDFVKEVEKLSKKKLSLKEQDEWEDYFNEYKTDLTNIKEKIEKTDIEINKMVYKLYGLNQEEIRIIEESLK